jgi:uncharacterized protein with von Willebrand factor type A (vWA) domain
MHTLPRAARYVLLKSVTLPMSRQALFLCLDKSGSMSGTPYNALKEGSILVAKSVFENKEFEHFITIFYDSTANVMVADNLEEYERKMRATNAGGGTCFFTCFEYI